MSNMFGIGNAYGSLVIKEENGKYFWVIEGYCGDDWQEIPKSLYDELVKFRDNG